MKKIYVYMCAMAAMTACGSEDDASPDKAEANLASIQENIFDVSCATSGCHDASSQEGDLNLSDADTSYAQLVSVAAVDTDAGGLERVTAGNAADSVLVMRLSGTDLGPRMPQGSAVLPDKAIAAITSWINAGAAK